MCSKIALRGKKKLWIVLKGGERRGNRKGSVGHFTAKKSMNTEARAIPSHQRGKKDHRFEFLHTKRSAYAGKGTKPIHES